MNIKVSIRKNKFLVELIRKIKKLVKSRKFKNGSVSTIITVLFISSALLVNMIVGILSEKYQLKLDLTSKKAFELSSESKDFLKGLNKDIQIDVLDREDVFKSKGNYSLQVSEILKQYAKCSDKIKVDFIDIDKNPSYASKFQRENLDADTSLVISSGNDYHVIRDDNLFDIEQNTNGEGKPVSSKAEQEITSTILNMVEENKPSIAFLKGYEEEDEFKELEDILKKNGYKIKDVPIVTSDIPEDCVLAIILGPVRDYMPESIEKLEKFLNNNGKFGKNIFYALNIQAAPLQNLENFLKKNGVEIKNSAVFETNPRFLFSNQNQFVFFSSYANDFYTKGLKSQKIPICIPKCKVLSVTNKEQVSVLTQSSKESGEAPLDDKDFKISKDKFSGPIPTSLVSRIKPSENLDSDKKTDSDEKLNSDDKTDSNIGSNIFVFGSHFAFDPQLLNSTHTNNSSYFINILKILSDKESRVITIESKSLGESPMNATAQDASVIGSTLIVILPIMILATCVFILLRRKNL
ncbi:MAG: GldG family protein [Oscillospiraceae bacterium]|nr:GldG family protein [Oscillospiraceae bacterium]